MRQQQEITISECLLYTLIFYSTIVHFICANFFDTLSEKQIPQLREKPQQVATEIVIIPDSEKCPSYYSSLIEFDWPGISEGYYCNDGKVYKGENSKRDLKDCQELEQIMKQTLNTFGFYNQNKSVIQSFKICGILMNVEKLVSNQETNKQDSPNALMVNKNTKSSQQLRNNQENNDTQGNKRFLRSESNSSNYRLDCLKGQKSCRYQNQVYCLGKDEKCPISNIFLQLQSNDGTKNNQEVISLGVDLQLVIERESSTLQPMVDLIVSESEGVCMDNINQVVKHYYELDKRTQCNQINQEYRQLFQEESFITSKQFYEINHINIAEHALYIPDEERYTLYAKQFNQVQSKQYNCITDAEYFDVTECVQDSMSFSRFLNYLTVTIVALMLLTLIGKKPPRLILPYINPIKLQNLLLLIALFVYLNTLWVLLVIQYNLGEVREDLVKFSAKDCIDGNTNQQIRIYLMRNSQEIQFGFLMAALYLPLIVFLACQAVKRFCWMRAFNNVINNPQNQQEMQARRRLIHR